MMGLWFFFCYFICWRYYFTWVIKRYWFLFHAFDRLLKFLWKLYLIFSLWKILNKILFFRKEEHLWFKKSPLCTSNAITYLKISNENIVRQITMSYVLNYKCYFLTWTDDYQPNSCTKFDDFRHFMYSQIKT